MPSTLILASLLSLVALTGPGCRPVDSTSQNPTDTPVELSFNRDIAPIVWEHCAPCHRPGEAGPFSLLTYTDVSRRADQIVKVTASRFMPPWLPDGEEVDFVGQRRLSLPQIDTIGRWIRQGQVEGVSADLPPMPKWPEGWQLGPPDLILRMPESYYLSAEGSDVYRNFVIPASITGERYVKAWELRPGNRQIVHHAVMRIDRTSSSQRLDRKDPEPGFGGMSMGAAQLPDDGHFLGWTPGRAPYQGHDDMAWRLGGASDFILQLHMRPSGKREAIRSSIGLYFTDQPPTRRPFAILLRDKTIDIPASHDNYIIKSSYELPVDVDVLSVYPHAHYLAKRMKVFATLADGRRRLLLHIPDWDFNWQDEYRYAVPVFLPQGTTVTMQYTYDNSADNSRNPFHPPRRVRYGSQSTDEMGELLIQVLPKREEEYETLQKDFTQWILQEDIASYETRLRVDPDDYEKRESLAQCLTQANRTDEAIAQWQECLRIQPKEASAYYHLGRAQLIAADHSAALRYLRRAVELDPKRAEAHSALGNVLQLNGNHELAVDHLRKALDLDPELVDGHINLGVVLSDTYRYDQAIVHFHRALKIQPDSSEAHYNLANTFLRLARFDEATLHYEQAIKARPEFSQAHTNWGIALQSLGNLDEAILHYQEAIEFDPNNADAHNNFGVALMAQRRIDQAMQHFRRALEAQPDHADARKNLTRASRRNGSPNGTSNP